MATVAGETRNIVIDVAEWSKARTAHRSLRVVTRTSNVGRSVSQSCAIRPVTFVLFVSTSHCVT